MVSAQLSNFPERMSQVASTGIPAEHWPMVIHHVVEKKEPLRTVAAAYGVSHETIRRLIRAAMKEHA
jgi:hypothetical protein